MQARIRKAAKNLRQPCQVNVARLALAALIHHYGTMQQTIQDFLASASGNASYREMGRVSGINHSTIRRQLTGEGELTAPVVVQLARAYSVNAVSALVAAGFITEDDASGFAIAAKLSGASDLELAHEILRRAMAGDASAALTGPIPTGELIVGGFGQNASIEEDAIPDNVEEAWAGEFAAHPKGNEPEDHTP